MCSGEIVRCLTDALDTEVCGLSHWESESLHWLLLTEHVYNTSLKEGRQRINELIFLLKGQGHSLVKKNKKLCGYLINKMTVFDMCKT